jgi:hypothetical protein
MIKRSKLFCSPKMMRNYDKEINTNYIKHNSLKVKKVYNGIVHPIEFDKYRPDTNESNYYGGVTDKKLKIIELSLNKMISPNFKKNKITCTLYKGARPDIKLSCIDYVDENVIFLGELDKHYGHFILEGLSRLWFCLGLKDNTYKCVYISSKGLNRFMDFFKIFGIEDKNLIKITKPTKFKSVTIPEPSIRLHDYCHIKYKKTIDKITEHVQKTNIDKVYFSKENIGNDRAYNEKSIRRVFLENGFNVFCPENLSIYKMISILKGCKTLAATSATNIHNSVFMSDESSIICLNRSAHFHPIQTMIEKIKSLKSTYVDVFYFSSDKNFGDQPCLLTPTKFLLNFFVSSKFKFSKVNLYLSFVYSLFKFFTILKIKQILIVKLYPFYSMIKKFLTRLNIIKQ